MAALEATDIVEGLNERFATVSALKKIITGEPKSIQITPVLYTIYSNYDGVQSGQVLSETHRLFHRVCFSYADPEAAEAGLLAMLTDIPAAVESDPKLGGRLTSGTAIIGEGTAGFVTIDGSIYRVIDFNSTVVSKRAISRG